MTTFSGIPDVDRLTLDNLDDKSLARTCGINKYMRDTVCNENYFHLRTLKWFPDTVNRKPIRTTWKKWYFRNADAKEILLRDYGFQFTRGDPRVYLAKIRIAWYNYGIQNAPWNAGLPVSSWNKGLVFASKNGFTDLVEYFIDMGATAWLDALNVAQNEEVAELIRRRFNQN